jgi:hypothetical protein
MSEHRVVSISELLKGELCTCKLCTVPQYVWDILNIKINKEEEEKEEDGPPKLIPFREILKGMLTFVQYLKNYI